MPKRGQEKTRAKLVAAYSHKLRRGETLVPFYASDMGECGCHVADLATVSTHPAGVRKRHRDLRTGDRVRCLKCGATWSNQ